jgi:hypothetical protein
MLQMWRADNELLKTIKLLWQEDKIKIQYRDLIKSLLV